jgi:H/ACA ribonucleoprotein complex subunit 2
LLVLAANITPMDVISHLPLLAEEAKGVEYVWVTSKEELGAASGTKRATSTVLIWYVDSFHIFVCGF